MFDEASAVSLALGAGLFRGGPRFCRVPAAIRLLARRLDQGDRARGPSGSEARGAVRGPATEVRLGYYSSLLRLRAFSLSVPGEIRLQRRGLAQGDPAPRDPKSRVGKNDRRAAADQPQPLARQEALDRGWYTGKSVRLVRPDGMAGSAPCHRARPHQRAKERPPDRESSDALPKLPQPNRYTRSA